MCENSPTKASKPLRLRYYTSLEETRLIELWRRNYQEITTYTEAMPIFRVIADGMCERNMKLNKQEVQRRINSYRNRYMTEKRRHESDANYKTEWELYDLIDCFYQSSNSSTEIADETKTLERIEAKIRAESPDLPIFTSQNSFKPVQPIRDPDGCPFLESNLIAHSNLNKEESESISPKSEIDSESELQYCPSTLEELLESNGENISNRSPLTLVNRALDTPCARRGIRRRSIIPRMGQITAIDIENLRAENRKLAERLKSQTMQLKLKQQMLAKWEVTFQFWLRQQDIILNSLKK